MTKEKNSKKPVNVVIEMLFTIFVAAILSSLAWAILAFIVANVINYDSTKDNGLGGHEYWMSAVSYTIFGLIIGYRARALNALGLAPKQK